MRERPKLIIVILILLSHITIQKPSMANDLGNATTESMLNKNGLLKESFIDVYQCAKLTKEAQRIACLNTLKKRCNQNAKFSDSIECFKSTFIPHRLKTVSPSAFTPQQEVEAPSHTPAITETSQNKKNVKAPSLPDGHTQRSEQLFGLKSSRKEKTTISSSILKIKKDGKSLRYIWLRNDQIWKEKYADSLKLGEGDEIVITKTGFGGFFLTKHGQRKRLSVLRVQ